MGREGGGSSSNNCLCSLCCSLFKLIFTLGIAVFIFWLIYRPTKIKVYVETASLTQFSFTNTTALNYNLTLDISIRNPNKRISFYYDYIEARALYNDENFGIDSNLPTFFQHHKNTTVLRPVFNGQAATLGSSVSSTFEREKREGFFYVEVRIYSKVRVKILFLKFGKFKPKFDCVVKLAVPSNKSSSSGDGFERTRCDVDF